jgi:hypothetical protein
MDHAERRRRQLHPCEIQRSAKTGRRFGVHENAKATERSEGDVVVLIACENNTFRILLQQRRGRPARLDS